MFLFMLQKYFPNEVKDEDEFSLRCKVTIIAWLPMENLFISW